MDQDLFAVDPLVAKPLVSVLMVSAIALFSLMSIREAVARIAHDLRGCPPRDASPGMTGRRRTFTLYRD